MTICEPMPRKKPIPAFLAYLANLSVIAQTAPEVAGAIVQELEDQWHYLKLIASENYCSPATQSAMGNLLTAEYGRGSFSAVL